MLVIKDCILQRLAFALLFTCTALPATAQTRSNAAGSPAAAQSSAVYNALVKQASDLLKSGSADQALTLSQTSISVDPDRWEAYELAGEALMSLHRYDEAIIQLTQANVKAPAAEQVKIRAYLKQSVLAGSAQQAAPVQAVAAAQPAVNAQPVVSAPVTPAAPSQPAVPVSAPVDVVTAAPPPPQSASTDTARTLDDTVKLILTTVNGQNESIEESPDTDAGYREIFDASSPSACVIQWSYLYLDYGSYNLGAATDRWAYTVNLAQVDPQSVKVTPIDVIYNAPGGYELSLSATSGSQFALTHYHLSQEHGFAWLAHNVYWKTTNDAKNATCGVKDKNCSNSVTTSTEAAFFASTPAIADQVTQAIKHAATLCATK